MCNNIRVVSQARLNLFGACFWSSCGDVIFLLLPATCHNSQATAVVRLCLTIFHKCHYQMFVSDLVDINRSPHSAQSCSFPSPWFNQRPTPNPFCLSWTSGTFTAVQAASERYSTCFSIRSARLTVQPTSEHFTPCNTVQPVQTPHTHLQSAANHDTTDFEHQ